MLSLWKEEVYRPSFKSQLSYLQQGDTGKLVIYCEPRFLNNKLETIHLTHRAPRKPSEQAWQLAGIQCQIWSDTGERQPPAKCSQLTLHTTHPSGTPSAALTHSAAASAPRSPGPTALQASQSHEGGFFLSLFFFPQLFILYWSEWEPLSLVQLCDLMDCSAPGSSVHGMLQEGYWNGLSFPSPGDLSDPGIKPMCPA